ncbi:hypothetical protein [Gordonibacter urolithinfaciens]|uniref:hypothetical protein n=1 Tax=Gordonibacter urolithinfaciens TaxID=1335613 RepID=UPI001E65B7F2|nr:hypothetical protein [Gordonibacter urolithinfaciens]
MMNAGRGKRAAGHASSAEGSGRAAPAASPRAVDPRLFSLVVIVGYGLFRGVNANSYLSAFASVEAPFLFVPDLFFNVVVACSVVVCSVTVIALVLRGRLGPLSMPYVAPAALFVAASLCALFGVFSWMPSDLALIVPGVLLGAASVMLSLVWVEVLACQEPRAIVTQIALSMLVNMVTSSVLSGLSGGARAAASCAALVVMVLCARYVRRALRTGAAGARAGGAVVTMAVGKGAAGDCAGKAARGHLKAAPRGSYRDAFLELGDSLVAFCVMEAVIGLLNSFMLAGSVTFAGSGSVSGVGMLIGILAFCVVVFVVQRIPRVSTAFRVLMPSSPRSWCSCRFWASSSTSSSARCSWAATTSLRCSSRMWWPRRRTCGTCRPTFSWGRPRALRASAWPRRSWAGTPSARCRAACSARASTSCATWWSSWP